MTVLVADISEFQPDVADGAYLDWSKAIIIRAMYGSQHDDKAWYGGDRRTTLHEGGALFVGIYQYVVAGQDAAAQARALLKLIGPLRKGEKLIGDFEEGAGDQGPRWRAWSGVLSDATGEEPWCYSDLDFAETHGLTAEWVAAFGDVEPKTPHLLWQFSNAYHVPGVGTTDCSIYHDSIDQLAALAYQGKPAPVPSPPADWQEAMMQKLPELKQGDEDHTGKVFFVHRAQALCTATGIAKCAIDGQFGPGTAAAVAAVQRHFGLPDNQVVDAATWSVLVTGSKP